MLGLCLAWLAASASAPAGVHALLWGHAQMPADLSLCLPSTGGLRERRHRGVPGGQAGPALLHRGQLPPAGGAHRHGGDHRVRGGPQPPLPRSRAHPVTPPSVAALAVPSHPQLTFALAGRSVAYSLRQGIVGHGGGARNTGRGLASAGRRRALGAQQQREGEALPSSPRPALRPCLTTLRWGLAPVGPGGSTGLAWFLPNCLRLWDPFVGGRGARWRRGGRGVSRGSPAWRFHQAGFGREGRLAAALAFRSACARSPGSSAPAETVVRFGQERLMPRSRAGGCSPLWV